MQRTTSLVLAILAAAALEGQTFEVASIKPGATAGESVTMRFSGGPETADPSIFICENCSISMLVTNAYGINSYQYSAPEWTNAGRFFVSATIPEGTTKEQFRHMQQNLLADRFKLKVHFEKKEMAQYELSVAKGGAKLKKSPEAGTEPRGGRMSLSFENSQLVYRSENTSLANLIGQLSNQLHSPITDATGLSGTYDISFHWASEENDTSGPTIFQAIQDQLGLKLEKKKIQVDILVVDHVEKGPTEN